MEHGSIEREIQIEASPEVVYEVISRAEHIREWWADEAVLAEGPDASGALTFDHGGDVGRVTFAMTVVEAEPPRRFAFRWTHAVGEAASPTNSLLVTVDLVPTGSGTTLRLVETGFRERGWEVAVLEATYADHVNGWNHFVPRLAAHAEQHAGARA